MSEVKKQVGKEVLKNAGSSFSSAVISGVAVGVLTPSQAFPKSSDMEAMPTIEEGDMEEVVVDPHSMSIDLDGDGTIDLVAVDENGDGIGDALYERIDDAGVSSGPEYMQVATSVDDSMSFSEAFAAARREVGAGGLFVWHGQTYGTYYKEEWDAMSEADKEEYWADVNHTTSHLNHLSGHSSSGSSNDSTDESDLSMEEDSTELEDVDLMASNDIDPDIPIDNNMDMSSFA